MLSGSVPRKLIYFEGLFEMSRCIYAYQCHLAKGTTL